MQDDSTKNDTQADDDNDLFSREVQDVKPIKTDKRIRPTPKKKPVRVQKHQQATTLADVFSDAPIEDCPDILNFSRSGVQPATLKRLRQGKVPYEHVIDLHGLTVDKARAYLLEFLAECETDGSRCVLIVHGKGYSSPGAKPVIKPLLNRWLPQLPLVLAYTSALPADGGTGAVYVLLKR